MIKVSTIINEYAPTRDKSTGEKCKVCLHGDQGDIYNSNACFEANCLPSAYVERCFHCGWTTSEEKCMSSLAPVSSGFHRDVAHCKLIMSKSEMLLNNLLE